MIAYAAPLAVGNAVKLIVAPPAGTAAVRLLRKTVDGFDGPDDEAAATIACDPDGGMVIDTAALVNGTPYYYRAYSTPDGVSYTTGETVTVTPACTDGVLGPDVFLLLRERLEVGLKAECAAGRLPLNDKGRPIAVLNAPPLVDNLAFPLVTIHLREDASGERAMGDVFAPDAFDVIGGEWSGGEGSLCRIAIDVVGWVSGNSDLRILLRNAMKRVMYGNLEVLQSAGVLMPDFRFSDAEDLEGYATPMFMVQSSLNCLAPYAVTRTVAPVADVTVTAST